MVSGGARFTGSKPRPPGRVIDVDVRPKHDTLYDALVVPADASTREIRRVAAALRRTPPEAGALHDICLAEQVLGRSNLRTEYDALLARLRAAGQPVPKIGTAIEGSTLGPSRATRVGSASRTGAAAAGRFVKGLLKVTVVLVILGFVLFAIGSMGGSKRAAYTAPEFKVDFKPIHIEIPKFDSEKYDREIQEILKHQQLENQELLRKNRMELEKQLEDIDKKYAPPTVRPKGAHRASANQTLPVAPSGTRDESSSSASTINK
jgi:hypothetical protein